MLRTIRQSNIQTAVQYTHQNIITERHSFAELARRNELYDSATLETFQQETGLADLYWHSMYYNESNRKQDLNQAILEADGYVFFMHGWTGSHRIWEDLPISLAGKHKNIVCFNFDLNGFGQSSFINTTPRAEQCRPPALMSAIEYWLSATGLWPAFPQRKRRPFYLFVGHSMSGAALFYQNMAGWHDDAYTFYALAPALFCNDTQRQTFFKTMGISIRFPSFTTVKDVLAPHVIDLFGSGASPQVKSEHLRIYNQTPFGTLAQTIYALGVATPPPTEMTCTGLEFGWATKIKL